MRKPVERYGSSMYYLLLTDADEPESFEEAMQVEDAGQETQETAQVELEEILEEDVLKKSQVNYENIAVQPEVQLR